MNPFRSMPFPGVGGEHRFDSVRAPAQTPAPPKPTPDVAGDSTGDTATNTRGDRRSKE